MTTGDGNGMTGLGPSNLVAFPMGVLSMMGRGWFRLFTLAHKIPTGSAAVLPPVSEVELGWRRLLAAVVPVCFLQVSHSQHRIESFLLKIGTMLSMSSMVMHAF